MQSMTEVGEADVELQAEEAGDGPGRPGEGGRRSAHRQAGEPDPDRRGEARAPATSTWSRTKKNSACASALTACCRRIMTPPLKLKDAITSPHEDHGQAGHQRKAPAAGRPHHAEDAASAARRSSSTSASARCPRCGAKRSCMRLLDKENLRLDMTKLGFEPESLIKFEKAILKPYGMVLVTGPTGSGKTNTLYSSIARLNTARHQHHDRRRSGRIPVGRASTRCR